ncbi:carboxy terminal-processing peptidase [Sphingobacterium corticis]|uniref:Carboxy terminal-processing peptidase n=1 Tax=Sphingobacterium corticis TaxID=1812823 RepID=A0ABW5NPQ5_9SPHI
MFKQLLVSLMLVSVLACGSKPRVSLKEEETLKPSAQHEVIAKEVANILENISYKKVAMGDSISNIVFTNLLNSVDMGKVYLLQSDIDDFEQYRNSISQDFREGDLSAPFYMFNQYAKRYIESMEYALSQVDVEHDFTKDEEYINNREKLGWFKTKDELNDQWRKRVKYDLLNLKLIGSDTTSMEKHKDVLRSRYKNLISQAKKIDANEVFQVVMGSLTDAVDPHTTYYNPFFAQAFNESMSNTLEGIGAQLMLENETVKITDIVAGGPAFKDKRLKVNDRIIGVAQGDGEFEDIVGWRLDAAVSKIKGPKGTKVRLRIIPAGQDMTSQPKVIELTRDKIVLAEGSAKYEIKDVKGDDGANYKVGVISLPKFYIDFDAVRRRDPNYKSATRDIRYILDTLKQKDVQAVVLDLRNNGGGSLQEAIELTGLFIDQGPVVQVKDVRNRVEINSDRDAGVAWDGPLGVMVNRFSASASEIFAGAIQDYGRGLILGSTTFGKGTVQSALDMSRFISTTSRLLLKASEANEDVKKNENVPAGAPEFGQINVTMGMYYRVSGSSTQHRGVEADVEFPSQFSADKFGESSEKSALPWDSIKPASFKRVADLNDVSKTLKEKHEKRIKKSPAYGFLLEDIRKFNEEDSIPKVSLNEVKLKAERDKFRKENRDRINEQRKFLGMPLWEEGKPQPQNEFDFILDESLTVMTDFIRMKR